MKLSLEQKQQQILSTQVIQQLQFFQLSYDQLLDKVQAESEENVMMEITQPDQLRSQGPTIEDPFYNVSEKQSLESYLSKQIEHLGGSQQIIDIAYELMSHIDLRGYITGFSDLSKQIQKTYDVSARTVANVLSMLQSLEPSGIAARSLKETLLIQIRDHDFEDERLVDLLSTVIQSHLADIESGNLEHIATACDIDIDAVEALISFIKNNLNPHPASAFDTGSSERTLIPSFKVSLVDGTLKLINLEASKGIQFTVSNHYLTVLNDPKTDDQTKVFLKEKLEKVTALKKMMQERQENLQSLMLELMAAQPLFFKKGPDYLVPLLQKDLTEKLDLSGSSISRLLNSKSVDTDHGVFLLKTCCPRRYFGETKSRLLAILGLYFDQFPKDSDRKIQERLNQLNIKMSRRSVAKYRLELNQPSSYHRAQKDTK